MNNQKLIAFHGDPKIKQKYVDRVRAHSEADEIIKGRYWENGKGCAVGCTLHSGDHSSYEDELGLPRIIARLEDRIFEGMSNEKAKEFPLKFLEAVPVGADTSMVFHKFMHWLLVDKDNGVIKFTENEKAKQAIQSVADTFKRTINGEIVSHGEWLEVRNAANAAASAANAAASAAVDAANAAYAVASAIANAANAAASTANAAASAYAAYAAAYAIANAANAAYAAASAIAAFTKGIYDKQADKLVELLSASPVTS